MPPTVLSSSAGDARPRSRPHESAAGPTRGPIRADDLPRSGDPARRLRRHPPPRPRGSRSGTSGHAQRMRPVPGEGPSGDFPPATVAPARASRTILAPYAEREGSSQPSLGRWSGLSRPSEGVRPVAGRAFSGARRPVRTRASVAQLAEHRICNPRVAGSSPAAGPIRTRRARRAREHPLRATPARRSSLTTRSDVWTRRERSALERGAFVPTRRSTKHAPRRAARVRAGRALRGAPGRCSDPSPRPPALRGPVRRARANGAPSGTAAVAATSPGRIPKRPTGADCKSAGTAFAGSNPAPPTITLALPGRAGRAFGAGAARRHLSPGSSPRRRCRPGRAKPPGHAPGPRTRATPKARATPKGASQSFDDREVGFVDPVRGRSTGRALASARRTRE